MSKLTKKQKIIEENLDREKNYTIDDAMKIIHKVKSNKFEESIDISIKLGIDPNKSDQNVRGAVTLPNSLGKEVTVAVFADGDQAKDASEAGAEYVGMDDLAEKFKKEEIDVEVVIATNAAMKVVGKLGQILGPKGLMPNPKTGTVTMDIKKAVADVKGGKIDFKVDKTGIIHAAIGKVSFAEEKIYENADELLKTIIRLKPSTTKGVYVKSIFMSSTMSPSISIDAKLG